MKVTERERLGLAAQILAGLLANEQVVMDRGEAARWAFDQVDMLISMAPGELVNDD